MNRLLRADLAHRAGDYCEVGGEPLRATPAIHHRKLRSQGGKDVLENLLVVCHGHHNLATRSIHLQPRLALVCGWVVPSWASPELTPIRLHARAMWDDRIDVEVLNEYEGPWYLIRGTEYRLTDTSPWRANQQQGRERDGES